MLVALAVVAGGCGGGDDPKPAATRTQATTPPPAPPPPAAEPAGPPWPRGRMLSLLEGRRLVVEGRTVRIDGSTLTCVGLGRRSEVRGRPAWARFRCVQPTFPAGSVVGPDAVFIAEPTGRRTLEILDARLTTY